MRNSCLYGNRVEAAKDLIATIAGRRKGIWSASMAANPPRNAPPPILMMDNLRETGSLRVTPGDPFNISSSINHHSRESSLIGPAIERVERLLRQVLETPRRPSRKPVANG